MTCILGSLKFIIKFDVINHVFVLFRKQPFINLLEKCHYQSAGIAIQKYLYDFSFSKNAQNAGFFCKQLYFK